jgi:hypothetical protein
VKTRWTWALVGAIVLLIVAAALQTDRCYVEEHRIFIIGTALGWFLAFVLSGKVIRVGLLAVALGVCSLHFHSEFTPSAEFSAIVTLRKTAVSVKNYKQSHLTDGYPATIPRVEPNCRARGLYDFRYIRERSSSSAVADRFMLVAVPVLDLMPRGLRSFALTEDGHLYATNPDQGRPANRTDRVLE